MLSVISPAVGPRATADARLREEWKAIEANRAFRRGLIEKRDSLVDELTGIAADLAKRAELRELLTMVADRTELDGGGAKHPLASRYLSELSETEPLKLRVEKIKGELEDALRELRQIEAS